MAFKSGVQQRARQGIGGNQNVEGAEEVLRQVGQPEQSGQVMQALSEDQIGGGKQRGKDCKDWQGDQDTAQNGPEAFPTGAGTGGDASGAFRRKDGLAVLGQVHERTGEQTADQPGSLNQVICETVEGPTPAQKAYRQQAH